MSQPTDRDGRQPPRHPEMAESEFTRTSLWLMMAGCCLSLPLAIAVVTVTGTSLPETRPVLAAIFAVGVVALVAIEMGRRIKTSRSLRQ